ncbi:MAG: rod shape-determining protein RodA [Nevskiaceae bacterium]|nr:MAG: rod shape-determining protein RodA [Nevskiaceae bacterium]TBR74447.1 MAG: rod shape-determining protein RodA [Nevskiaceae bacterium]
MSSTPLSTASEPKPVRVRRLILSHVDPWLLMLLLGVGAVGLVTLYSAGDHSLSMVIDQAERLALGFAVMIAVAQLSPEWLRSVAPWLYAFSLLLLLVVLAVGDHGKGAQRWLVVGPLRFQPSELMKLGMPLAIAAYLHVRALPPSIWTTLGALAIIGVPVGLIALQPDLGTAVLVLAAGVLALYFGGLRWRWVALALGAVAAAAPLLWMHLHDYQRERLMIFLNPELDPLGAGYHITQSKIAIGSGGLWGKGWLMGTQAKLDFLPEAHTDFIFSVYGEEMGLIGALVLLSLYAAIVGRCLVIAMRGQDTFQRLLAAALGVTFFVYVFINIGMVIGLLPVVGVPLPMVSYGGTSVVSLLAGFGMLMSLHTHRKLLTN